MLSIPHMIVVFIVVLVVFGPQKLPELARGLGKLMAEFRKASTDFRNAFEEEMRDLERQALLAQRKKAAEAVAAAAPAEPSPPATVAPTAAGGETPSNEAQADPGAAEPSVSPVAESVARSMEEPVESKSDSVTPPNSQESHPDAQHLA